MTRCLVISHAGADLERGEITRRVVGADEIKVDIHFCGVCHSDIHHGRNEWGRAFFPLVPGHEATGIVAEIGAAVTKFKVGDRVGVGVYVDSCGNCASCERGAENYCLKGRTQAYNAPLADGQRSKGGYSTDTVVRESFAQHIPDNLPLDAAAPLLCAGITTYAPLRQWQVTKGTRVGVVGVGGLGHLAIKQAVAMGAEVIVFGRTDAKKADALAFGASEFVVVDDQTGIEKITSTLDILLNTVAASVDVDFYLDLLRPQGVLVMLGLPLERLDFDPFKVVYVGKIIAGSNVAPMAMVQEMLDFCSQHNIVSDIELCTADEINTAWDRVVDSSVRYRYVLDTKTI